MRDLHHSSSVSDGCRTEVLAGPAPKNVGAKHLRRRAGKYTLEFYHFTIYVAFAAVLARAFFPMRDL
jgi:hypothetical protein